MIDAGEHLEAPSTPADDAWILELERVHRDELAFAEALERFRARWAHPPVDRADIEERVALRLIEVPEVEAVVLGPWPPHVPACRLFVRRGDGWRSRYVHSTAEVDEALAWCRS